MSTLFWNARNPIYEEFLPKGKKYQLKPIFWHTDVTMEKNLQETSGNVLSQSGPCNSACQPAHLELPHWFWLVCFSTSTLFTWSNTVGLLSVFALLKTVLSNQYFSSNTEVKEFTCNCMTNLDTASYHNGIKTLAKLWQMFESLYGRYLEK